MIHLCTNKCRSEIQINELFNYEKKVNADVNTFMLAIDYKMNSCFCFTIHLQF